MSKNHTPASQELQAKLIKLSRKLSRFSYLFFIVFVAALYGYVLYRGQSLRNTEPSDDAVASNIKASDVPHIDPKLVRDLQSLQDNSVNVQTLFDQARNDPFQ